MASSHLPQDTAALLALIEEAIQSPGLAGESASGEKTISLIRLIEWARACMLRCAKCCIR